MRYLVDADWLIVAAAGRSGAVRTLERLSVEGLVVSTIAVAEIYEGAFGSTKPDATLAAFRAFLGSFVILILTDPIVERFALLRAGLRQHGQLIPDMDLLIAATTLDADLTLVSRNVRHFERIADLKLFQPGKAYTYWQAISLSTAS